MKRSVIVILTGLIYAAVVPICSFGDLPERATTSADQRHINLTVYNDGNALIHDTRSVALRAGVNRIAWCDVSANMDPASALLDTLDTVHRVSVLEQNFNYECSIKIRSCANS